MRNKVVVTSALLAVSVSSQSLASTVTEAIPVDGAITCAMTDTSSMTAVVGATVNITVAMLDTSAMTAALTGIGDLTAAMTDSSAMTAAITGIADITAAMTDTSSMTVLVTDNSGFDWDMFDLDLLMNQTNEGNNPLELLGDMILDASHTIDAAGFVDRSAGKAVLSTKASDFSVDEDGLTSSGFTFSANETINSVAGFLKCIANAGTGQTSIALGAAYGLGTNNVTVMRLKFLWAYGQNDSTTGQFYQYFPLARRDFTIANYPFGANYQTEIFVIQSSVKNIGFTGATVDRSGKSIYIKDIITEKIDGNHFFQTTASKMPHRNFTDYMTDFDGVGHNITDVSGDFASAVGADTQGMVTMFIRDDVGAGVKCDIFSFNSSGGTHRIDMELRTSNVIRVQTIISGVFQFIDFPITRGVAGAEFFSIQFGNDGSNYKCYINGVDTASSGGTDSGIWFNSFPVAMAQAAIGRNYSVAYGNFGLRHFGYVSGRIMTATEVSDLNSTDEYQEVYSP